MFQIFTRGLKPYLIYDRKQRVVVNDKFHCQPIEMFYRKLLLI